LEQNRGGQGADQRQSHQLAHARHAWLVGEPKAAERRRRRQRAEKYGTRQG
jgi:hypothetical protein